MSNNLSPGGYVRQGQRGVVSPRSVNVQVAVRCRPLNERESNFGEKSIIKCDEGRREVTYAPPNAQRKNIPSLAPSSSANPSHKTFTYDHVFGPRASQADLYERVVEPIVDEVIQGYNCTVFAYGQTGTGKTHTMEGRRSTDMVEVSERRLAENAGIIPRAVQQIFDHLRSLSEEHSVRVSHLELYNEQLTDLLGQDEFVTEGLRVYEDPQKGTFVQGLDDVVVQSEEEIFSILDKSAMKRKTAETLMNKYSSRSHSIFSITIHIRESTPDGADLLKVGKLNLVDLAGSENVGRSGAVKGRAREAGNINQSLLTLGRVITALVDRHPHVPYRDSKLTRLLQESLGGRNKTCVIATITPGSSSFEETASTLDYAYRAKSIKNRPTVNQMIAKHELLKEYTEEIAKIKRELDATRNKNGIHVPPDEYERLTQISNDREHENDELRTLNEEFEKKLDETKEKLEKTRIAQARDQETLRKTKSVLEQTEAELTETKDELEVTQQQKEERGVLVKSHVATEASLVEDTLELQKSFAMSTADVEALQDRVDARRNCDKTNETNLQSLNVSVNEGIQKLLDKLGDHQNSQQSLFASSKNNIDSATSNVCSGLIGLREELGKIYSTISEQTKENVSNVSNQFEQFSSETEGSHSKISSHVDQNMKDMENIRTKIENACTQIYKLCEESDERVLSMQASVSEHQKQISETTAQFFAKHEQAIDLLNTNIGNEIQQHRKMLEDMSNRNQKEAGLRKEMFEKTRSNVIEQITNSLASLLLQNQELEEKRTQDETETIHHMNTRYDELETMVKKSGDDMMENSTELESKTKELVTSLSTNINEAKEMHDANSEHLVKTSETVKTDMDSLVKTSLTHKQNVNHESETSTKRCKEFIIAQTDRLSAEEKQLSSKIDECEEKTHKSTENVMKSTRETLGIVNENCESLESRNEEFSATINMTADENIGSVVKAFKLNTDKDDDLVPGRREWQGIVAPVQTRNHTSIIQEYRQSQGLREVLLDDFGHTVGGTEDVDPNGMSNTESDVQSLKTEETNDGDTGIESGKENITESLISDSIESGAGSEQTVEDVTECAEQKGLTPSNSHDALDEVRRGELVFTDSTNHRRLRTRSKRKLDTAIRKKAKPSGIPLPRSRSSRHVGNGS